MDEGQVWYNNTSYAFKLAAVTTTGTWAAGGSLNTTRRSAGSFGIQTNAVAGAGLDPGNNISNVTEKYNGTSWTSNPTSYNTSRYLLGTAGTATSGLSFGGFAGPGGGTAASTASESWNGSAWTNTPSLNTARYNIGGAGASSTSALAMGGVNPPTVYSSVESYNGSAWTNLPTSLPAVKHAGGSAGIQTSALYFGGSTTIGPADPGINNTTASYNGSSWTSGGNLNTSRSNLGGAGATNSSAVAFGGYSGPPSLSATETYNGTSWTNNPTGLSTARYNVGAAGTQTLALCVGGYNGSANTGVTEAWTGPGNPTTKTITTS